MTSRSQRLDWNVALRKVRCQINTHSMGHFMRNLLFAGLIALVGLNAPDRAEADTVVVELFTSQGCSSCPPADKLLGEIAKRDGVIALSLHVDYWDYLGWKDIFGNPAFTNRQRGYAKAANSTMIYTPQMVIGGTDHIVGTKAMDLADALEVHGAKPTVIALKLARSGNQVSIDAMPKEGASMPARMLVQLVRYSAEQTVAIARGENAGRNITYHNVVTSWTLLGEWDGSAPLDVSAKAEGDAPAVVIIQDGASGPILAAARLD